MSKSWCFHWILTLESAGKAVCLPLEALKFVSVRRVKVLPKEFSKMSWACRWCLCGDWTNYKVCSGRPQCMHLCLWPNWNRKNLHNGKSQFLHSIFQLHITQQKFPLHQVVQLFGEWWGSGVCHSCALVYDVFECRDYNRRALRMLLV